MHYRLPHRKRDADTAPGVGAWPRPERQEGAPAPSGAAGCPPAAPGDAPALIQVEHLSRSVGADPGKTVILDDVSFAVPARSLFAITGPSGSGKSTILNLLTGIDRPTSGRVLVAGQDLRALGEDDLARWRGRHVGIVFQFFQLLPTLTALENVLLALELGHGGGLPRRRWRACVKRRLDERALACLALARVDHLANRLPGVLSGGEQQRVAVARALANDPPVLVADEPTGNLDSRTAREVFATLAGLTAHGKTVIYVTHSRDLAARADARIALLDGRIADRDAAPAAAGGEPEEGGRPWA
ncbi:MAG TPA: ABC transporter ATP-binding protein [Thermomicrobiales bacterium]|nr:ABC transporter ATP-binding protein [Thermomicrobiales bacterium]